MRKSTEKQQEASRSNGKLSRGPVTPEGKRRVSRNALRHGLFAKAIVLDNERKQNFTNISKQYRNFFQPENALEEGLIEELTAAFWRMRRLWAIETRLLNQKMPNQNMPDQHQPGNASTGFGLCPPDVHQFADDPGEYITEMNRITSSFTSLADTPAFKLVLQHEGRLHRNFQRALRGLILLRGAKAK